MLGVLTVYLAWEGRRPTHVGPRLVVYCAAGLKAPVEELALRYEERTGARVELHFGGSGALLSGPAVVPEGDLYLAGDASYLERARERELVEEVLDLALGAIDAAVIWDATAAQMDGVSAVRTPELDVHTQRVAIGVLRASLDPTGALRFARFLAARDEGAACFSAHGFEPFAGDAWALQPELVVSSGAMLGPAVEETIAAFEQREGCVVRRVVDGCGILVAQIRMGTRPDAFLACDESFMARVAEFFDAPLTLSSNQIGLLVARGNPHGLRELADLARSELRVGLAHPEKSALAGRLRRALGSEASRARFEALGFEWRATGEAQ